jgi:hypothetical protein
MTLLPLRFNEYYLVTWVSTKGKVFSLELSVMYRQQVVNDHCANLLAENLNTR